MNFMKKTVFFLSAVSLLCYLGISAAGLNETERYTEISVQDNDTLWDIAARHADSGTDVRKYIYSLQKLNDITDPGKLKPGQIIKIPAEV